ncbi:membrane-bound lytic murein transglycosylase MltF [Guyparkeria sp.]|uniref:membrane-bound lytic murein transglycosylase MltF n=1 Tax=Guyparkeria sp. TaxID=2035736 RepID=UPI00397110FD
MRRFILPLLLASMTLVSTGCERDSGPVIESPDETGVLVVATRNAGTTWYLDREGQPTGPEHDLVTAFAKGQGWTVHWRVFESTAEVIGALEDGEAHLAAAGLTHLPERDANLDPGLAHTRVVPQVVCHREDRPLPRSPAELARVDLRVTADSSYAGLLWDLAASDPEIRFREDPVQNTEVLLTRVALRELDCTVADSNIVRIVRRHWPHLDVAMDLGARQQTGWYVVQGQDGLAATTRAWRQSEDGEQAVERMRDRYYAHLGEFDFVDWRALNRRLDERLPRFRAEFERAARVTGMPADLLAAMAYQESHWDPEATSPTGVRGLMMLTQSTARSLGVENRLDPAESIEGGARYLADRHERLPDDIPEPDRTYLALASYNIGRAHVLDARELARALGKDPDSWADMREVLPLKADKRYYPQTKYGYARGYEPVQYVQRIRNYRDVIAGEFDPESGPIGGVLEALP